MAKPKSGQRKGGKANRKHGRKIRKPAQRRYVAEGRLEQRKIRNLVRCNGMTESQARLFWHEVKARRNAV